MKRLVPASLIAAAVIGLTMQPESACANVRLDYPDDLNGPPFFAFPIYEPDQEWTPIVFYRNPAFLGELDPEMNLFDLQFEAWAYPLLADGFVIFTDDFIPFHQVLHGIDMPIWFVPTEEFETLLTFDENGPIFTVADLSELSGVCRGTATHFLETSQFFGGANVPFAEVQSKGVLDGGGSFSIHLSEAWLPPDGEHNIFHYEIVVECSAE